jgi:hypothetical protein
MHPLAAKLFHECFGMLRDSEMTRSAITGSGSALIHRSSATNEWPLNAAKGATVSAMRAIDQDLDCW